MQYDGSTPEQIPIATPNARWIWTCSNPPEAVHVTNSRRHPAPRAIPLSHCRMTWSPNGDQTVHDPHAGMYPTVQPPLVSLPPDGLIVSRVCWRLQISPRDVFVSGRVHLSTHAKIMSTISCIVYVHLSQCHTTNPRDSFGRFCALCNLRRSQFRMQSALPTRLLFRHRAVRRVWRRPCRATASLLSPRCLPG